MNELLLLELTKFYATFGSLTSVIYRTSPKWVYSMFLGILTYGDKNMVTSLTESQ